MARRAAQLQEDHNGTRNRHSHVDLVLSEYDETFLRCRDLMHAWRIVGYYQAGGTTYRSLLCIECGMEGTDTWDGIAAQPRKYRQPDGYRIEGGRSKAEVRQEQIRRSHIYDSEEAMRKALKPSVRRRLHSVS